MEGIVYLAKNVRNILRSQKEELGNQNVKHIQECSEGICSEQRLEIVGRRQGPGLVQGGAAASE